MTSENGVVNLVSREGESFQVPIPAAKMSQLVSETFDGDDDDDKSDPEKVTKDIPLPNVSSEVLEKIIEFMQHYQNEQMTPIEPPFKSEHLDDLVQKWYADFVDVDRELLFDMVAAANFMDIKPLLDLSCLAVSIMIKGKSAEELREMFHMNPEPTPQEVSQVQEENSWSEHATRS